MGATKQIVFEVVVTCCLALFSSTAITSQAAEKSLPIIVEVNIPESVLVGWPPEKKTEVLTEIRRQLMAKAKNYFREWWDIVPECQSRPKATLRLGLIEDGPNDNWEDLYLQLRLTVDVNWADGAVSKSFDLTQTERWKEQEVLEGFPVAPPTPENTQNTLLDFMHKSFPDDWIKRKMLLLRVVRQTPVAVDARWLDVREKTFVLPFPKTARYMPFFNRSFRLCCSHRYLGVPPLTAKANDLWGRYDQGLTEALKATVIESPSSWDPNHYERAVIYLHDEDPFWDAY